MRKKRIFAMILCTILLLQKSLGAWAGEIGDEVSSVSSEQSDETGSQETDNDEAVKETDEDLDADTEEDAELLAYIKEAQSEFDTMVGQENIMALVYLCDYYQVKKAPDESAETVLQAPSGTTVLLKGVELDEDYNIWFRVSLESGGSSYTGYIDRSYLAYSNEHLMNWENTYFPKVAMFAAASTSYMDVEQFPASYQQKLILLKQEHPDWIFVRQNVRIDWQTVVKNENYKDRSLISGGMGPAYKGEYYGSGWYYASEEAVRYYLDPRNFLNDTRIFQFEQLTYNPSYHSKNAVQNILNNTFMKGSLPSSSMTYADAFFQIGSSLKVSPFHLACRVYQEQGEGKSALISGTYDAVLAYKGYYNYYNISAAGKTTQEIVESGLAKAVALGWNTPYASIKGGAEILAKNYILRGQDTLYLQKFDVDASDGTLYTHQYMQNIMAPYTESSMVRSAYAKTGALDSPFVFKIPVYDNMPEQVCPVPSGTPTPAASPTPKATATPTASPTATATPTTSPTATPTVTPTTSPTATPKATAIPTTSPTATPKATATPMTSPTATPTTISAASPTVSPAPKATVAPAATPTTAPVSTPKATSTPTVAQASTPKATTAPTTMVTATPKATAIPTAAATPKATEIPTAAATPKVTAAPTASAVLSASAVPTVAVPAVSASPTASAVPAVSVSPTASAVPAVSASPSTSAAPTASATPSTSAAPTANAAPSAAATPAATPKATAAPTVAATPAATNAPTTASASSAENNSNASSQAASTTVTPETASTVGPENITATSQPAAVSVNENTNSAGVTVAAVTSKPQTAAENKDVLIMDMSKTEMIYARTLQQIKEQGREVVLQMNDQVSWIIHGNMIETDDLRDINLKVTFGNSRIPRWKLEALTENETYVEMSLEHEGEFGFTVVLSVQLEEAQPDQYANLFYYNEQTGDFEFMCASLTNSKCSADFEFKHASDYVIIISNETKENLLEERAEKLASAEAEAAQAMAQAKEELPAEEPKKAAGIIVLILLASAALGIGAFLIFKKKD